MLNYKNFLKIKRQKKEYTLKFRNEEFAKKYLLLINLANVICELKKDNLLNNTTFFKLYQFMEYASNFPPFTKDYEDPHSFYALMILFFMDLKGYEYNFTSKEFITKTAENKMTDNIML